MYVLFYTAAGKGGANFNNSQSVKINDAQCHFFGTNCAVFSTGVLKWWTEMDLYILYYLNLWRKHTCKGVC